MEELIESVRVKEILYNTKSPNYRDQNKRQEAWDEIGCILDMKAELAKDNWDKLRRCFMNAINRRRSKKNGREAKKIPPWKYERQMSFLLPFVEPRRTHRNVIEEEEDNKDDVNYADVHYAIESESLFRDTRVNAEESYTDPQEEITHDKREVSQRLDIIKRIKREGCDSPGQEGVLVTKENASLKKDKDDDWSTKEMDETEMFFLSMAKMSKKLPPLEQAKIKLQLSNAVLQAQITMHQDQKQHVQCFPSTESVSDSA